MLLLHPATRELLPWVPVVMTLVSLLLIIRVSMPAPVRRSGDDQRPSPYAALRESPAAKRAIAVMAAINLVLALVAVALLPLAMDTWSSDAAGYGLATGVLGFAAFGAPLLRRLGRTSEHSIVWGLALLALGLVLVVPVPSVGWALAPLALAGAAAVGVEAGATAVLQENVCDEVRASVLGINDTVIIAAALVGSLLAPVAVGLVGGAVLLCSLAATILLVAWWARPRGSASSSAFQRSRRPHAGYRRERPVWRHMNQHDTAPYLRWTALLAALLCAVSGCSFSSSGRQGSSGDATEPAGLRRPR